MFTLLGLRLSVIVEIFCRKEKKVIRKNELKMIYCSSLHKQGIASSGSGLHLTVWGVGPEGNTEILTWLILTNQAWLSLLVHYCAAEQDTALWHHLSQNVQMTPAFQHLHLLPFFVFACWIRSTLSSMLGQMVWSPPAFCCPLVLRAKVIGKNKQYGGTVRTLYSFSTKISHFKMKLCV